MITNAFEQLKGMPQRVIHIQFHQGDENQLTKSEMKEAGKIDDVVQKIKRACELRQDNKMLAEMEQRQREKEELINELKRCAEVRQKG